MEQLLGHIETLKKYYKIQENKWKTIKDKEQIVNIIIIINVHTPIKGTSENGKEKCYKNLEGKVTKIRYSNSSKKF